MVQRLNANMTIAGFAAPGVKRWTCIDPKPDMLSLRTSFQSHLNVSAGASASPQAAMS